MRAFYVSICLFFSLCYNSHAQTIVDNIAVRKASDGQISKFGSAYPFNQYIWYLSGCIDDFAVITLSQYGDFALVNGDNIIQRSNGGNSFTFNLAGFSGGTIKDMGNGTYYESVAVMSLMQKEPITTMVWNVGNNDTLGICQRTAFSIPTQIAYQTPSNSSNSFLGNGFFYEINGINSTTLNLNTLKTGDVLRLAKPKGVDAFNLPECATETAETLYSQKVVVKMVNTAGRLSAANSIQGTQQICPGDSLLLSVFYSQCVGSYLKNGQPYPTSTWIDPNSQYYSPYKQAKITTPGTYYMIQMGNSINCGQDKYNCPATSKDFVVTSKPNCKSNRIFGTVYEDANGNDKYEVGEKLLSGVKVKITDLAQDTVIGYGYTNEEGNYDVKTNASLANGCTILIDDPDFFQKQVILSSPSYFNKVNLPSYRVRNNVEVSLSTGRNRPGFEVPVYFSLTNRDTVVIRHYTLRLTLDSKYTAVTYLSASPKTIAMPEIVWEFDSLKPGQQIHFMGQFRLSFAATLGDLVSTNLSFKPYPLDSDTSDNIQRYVDIITGSFDPNEKVLRIASPYAGYAQDTSTLDYTIHFQNMGTDTAFTVVVKDKLSSLLDFGYFEMRDASHPYTLTQEDDTLIWTFKKILLPDNKTNEPASHGHVHFKIKPKAKTPQGAKILNRADIYFDFNTPIATNVTSCTFGVPTVTDLEEKSVIEGLHFYPNPTTGYLTVACQEVGRLELLDMRGRLAKTIEIGSTKQSIEVSDLEAGPYLCRFITKEQTHLAKLIKLQ